MGQQKQDTTIEVIDDQGIKRTIFIPDGTDNNELHAPKRRGACVKLTAYIPRDNDTDQDDSPRKPFQEIYDPESTEDYINAIGQNDDFMQAAEIYSQLTSKQQAAYYLRIFRNAGPTELSQCLGISTPAAKQLLDRAIKKMGLNNGAK